MQQQHGYQRLQKLIKAKYKKKTITLDAQLQQTHWKNRQKAIF